MDAKLNTLLKWGIENSVPGTTTQSAEASTTPTTNGTSSSSTAIAARAPAPYSSSDKDPSTHLLKDSSNNILTPSEAAGVAAPRSQLNPEVLAALFGGPSEAELMKAAIAVITCPTTTSQNDDGEGATLENKLIAFDNFEQLIESLDNANNLENLSLWAPLLSLLSDSEAEIRRMAAWCVGTAVQNNARTQERLFAMGGIPQLVALATSPNEPEAVRRKAIYALSSAVRNYQPSMDAAVDELTKLQKHDAGKQVDATDMDAVDEVMNALKRRVSAAAAAATKV
ncbi:nucleotide exchange factor Fes1-domain-containing protein [Podospora didyma]|uniref:Nucleotide exchange factor Fes1-domain-containing protein n=1 Tax=Podospora didyma TaxID=330526 RepID=A0AAE0KKN7_9PEZI|nr:nucleotide exchange factor Fes1-domain-containing protein [Podospora didyma]